MPENARGPSVDVAENLYRAITCSEWWKAELRQPSSAAFNYPKFSVDIASRCTVEEALARRRKPGCGLVRFNCGAARELGFDARDELDPDFPDNETHANVYCDFGSKRRKKRARELASHCDTIRTPSF